MKQFKKLYEEDMYCGDEELDEILDELTEFRVIGKAQRRKIARRMARLVKTAGFKTKVKRSMLRIASVAKQKVKAAKLAKQQVIDKLLQMKVNLPNHKYVIYERDIVDILIAFNDGNYEWILDFFETLTPVDGTDNSKTYSFEQLLANAGITFQGK